MLKPSRPDDDRRFAARTPVRLVGRIWHGDGARFWTECTLRDLSSGGARIECAGAGELPARVFFAHQGAEAIFLAQVKWRRGGAAGLQFASGFTLDQCVQPPLDRLAAEWRALFA